MVKDVIVTFALPVLDLPIGSIPPDEFPPIQRHLQINLEDGRSYQLDLPDFVDRTAEHIRQFAEYVYEHGILDV